MSSLPKAHREFLEWATNNGIKLHKVAPAEFKGSGVGMIATADIQPNDVLTTVPSSLLINLASLRPPPEDTTAHGLLAAQLLSDKEKLSEWKAILPKSLELPMFWLDEEREGCTHGMKQLVQTQLKKFERDFSAAGKGMNWQDYAWAWAIVNSRTLHFRPKHWSELPAEDCMTMCPMIDYYNHEPDDGISCNVTFSTTGYEVMSQRSYKAGEEIFVTYGSHGNDELLCEYGFTLDDNKWDSHNIDDIVLKRLSAIQQKVLQENGFLGHYTLSASGLCFRTIVALNISRIPDADLAPRSKSFRAWKRIIDGTDDGVDYSEEILEQVKEQGEQGLKSERQDLRRRWEQVLRLVETQEDQ